MREVEVPPLPRPMERYRLEVGDRAAKLTRRRRGVRGGFIVTGLLVVVAVVSVVGIGTSPTGVHGSASAPGRAPTGTAPGATFGANGPASPPPRPSLSSAAPEDGSASPATDTERIVDPASGSTSRVVSGTHLTVVLPQPVRGRWGDARIVTGRGSVLTFVHQAAEPGGGVQITLRPVNKGVATVKVACIGNPTGSWHGTIEVGGR